jgi:HTH-type transcriptional repressor of NAD biosynthesis genes
MIHGLVLGKFLPPHAGHVYLVEFARRRCDVLTVVVGSLSREPIPGALRFQWMKQLFPAVNVVRLTDENPQTPEEHPEFWAIWKASLERVLPCRPQRVFASEAYGAPLASLFDATFIPVDPGRSALPTSGTAVRADPWAHWSYLPRPVRPHFLRRISLFGPESTGKSTLASELAAHYGTVAVPEYARTYLEMHARDPRPEDLVDIALGQVASEDALAFEAHRRLICDTDPLLTTIWSEVLFGSCHPTVENLAQRPYDLTLLLDVDLPWVPDPVRYRPDDRHDFLRRCEHALDRHRRHYVRISGTGTQRLRAACSAIDEIPPPRL